MIKVKFLHLAAAINYGVKQGVPKLSNEFWELILLPRQRFTFCLVSLIRNVIVAAATDHNSFDCIARGREYRCPAKNRPYLLNVQIHKNGHGGRHLLARNGHPT